MTGPARIRVLISGAEGNIGSALRRHWGDRYDIHALTRHPADFPSHTGDIADLEAILPAFEGIEAVVHLAAVPDVDASWDDVLHSNIIGLRNVFEAARLSGVRTVVFASSNHAIGMYEEEAAPALYALDDPRVFDASVEVRPDSLYGVSKAFGEALGRFYSERYGMRVICVRIGSVRPDNDPCAPEVTRPDGRLNLTPQQSYDRLRSTWLSHRDCAELFARCIEAQGVRWAIVYGISDNPRQFWDISRARELLGYQPHDSAPESCG
jgi:nucleoside-diphosphate-sugar epimerase